MRSGGLLIGPLWSCDQAHRPSAGELRYRFQLLRPKAPPPPVLPVRPFSRTAAVADWGPKHAPDPAGGPQVTPSANQIPPHSPWPRPARPQLSLSLSFSRLARSRGLTCGDTGSKVSQQLYDGSNGGGKSHDQPEQAARAHAPAESAITPRPEKRARDSRRSWDLPGDGKESVEMEDAKDTDNFKKIKACLRSSRSGGVETETPIEAVLASGSVWAGSDQPAARSNNTRPKGRKWEEHKGGEDRSRSGPVGPHSCACARARGDSGLFEPSQNFPPIWGRSFTAELHQWGGSRKSFCFFVCVFVARARTSRRAQETVTKSQLRSRATTSEQIWDLAHQFPSH